MTYPWQELSTTCYLSRIYIACWDNNTVVILWKLAWQHRCWGDFWPLQNKIRLRGTQPQFLSTFCWLFFSELLWIMYYWWIQVMCQKGLHIRQLCAFLCEAIYQAVSHYQPWYQFLVPSNISSLSLTAFLKKPPLFFVGLRIFLL